jgi:hypothetical protein
MYRIIILLSLFLVVISCSKDNNEEMVTPKYLNEEVYSVYGLLLYPLSSVNIVVSTTDTSLNCSDLLLVEEIDRHEISLEVINQCIELNKKEFTFESDKLLSGGLRLVSQEEIDKAESSVSVYEKYGATGMYRFGLPVFFDNGKSAMYEVDYSCGPWCGNGAIIIAKKINDNWSLEHYIGTWISK